jgi:hypothetical protein
MHETTTGQAHPNPKPVRCAACEYLYFPQSIRQYLCDVCQASLEDYTASMAGHENPTIAWWRRQAVLRDDIRGRREAGSLEATPAG